MNNLNRLRKLITIFLIIQAIQLNGQEQDYMFHTQLFGNTSKSIIGESGMRNFRVFPLSDQYLRIIQPFRMNDFVIESGGRQEIDFKNLSQLAKNHNRYALEMKSLLFSFSKQGLDNSQSFVVSDEINGACDLSGSFFSLVQHGNYHPEYRNVSLKIPVYFSHYRSFAYQFTKKIKQGLSIDISPRLLFGKSFLNARVEANLLTSTRGDTISVTTDGVGKVSSPLQLEDLTTQKQSNAALGNYLFRLANPGLGIDISLQYKMNENMHFMMGMRNLGFIFWNDETTKFSSNMNYSWQGLDFAGRLDPSVFADVKGNERYVSLRDDFLNKLLIPDDERFFSALPFELLTAMNYKVNELFGIQALLRHKIAGRFVNSDYLVLLSHKHDGLRIASGLALLNFRAVSWPFSFAYATEKLQIEVSSLNVLSLIVPASQKVWGLQFGLQVNIGKKSGALHDYPFYRKYDKRVWRLLLGKRHSFIN